MFLRDYTPDETSGQNWVFWPSVSEGLRYKAVVNGIADYQKKHGPILIDRSLAPSLKYYYPEQSFDTYMYKEGENEEVFEMFGTGRYSGLYFPKIENFSSKFEVYGDNYRLEKTDLQGLYLINYLNR